jgi:hypothetical protein
MTDFDPFEQSLHDSFTRGDVDDDAAYEQVVARGRTKQRRRATAIAGVTGGLVMILFVAVVATTGSKSSVSVASPFGGNGIAATTSSAPESTTTVRGQVVVPPPTSPDESTTPTTQGACPALPSGSSTSAADLEATITFGVPSVVQGDPAPYTMTIVNRTDHTVAVYVDHGTVFAGPDPIGGGLSWQGTTTSDADTYVVICGGTAPYLVVPPHTTINESGTASTDSLGLGLRHLTLWTEHQELNEEQFGGPGGTITIIAPTATTTTTESTTTPTTTLP